MSSTPAYTRLGLEDAVFAVLWLAATLSMIRAAWNTTKHAFPDDGLPQKTLHAGVVFVGMCILNLTLLGAVGVLSRETIIVGGVVISVLAGRLRVVPSTGTVRDHEPVGAWLMWATLVALMVGHSVVHGLFRFPEDWDCLMYHLPFIDHWLQSRSLAATGSLQWSHPANSELLGVWFAGPFTGDFLIGLNNTPVMVIWASGLLELSRQLGIRNWLRHTTTVACLAVHTAVHETDDASNDLMVAACFVAGMAYALRFHSSSSTADLILFGMTLGILAGTKYFAIGYAALLGVIFIILGIVANRRRRLGSAVLCSIGVSVLFCGYWYIRNFIATGHPLFPLGSPRLRESISQLDLSDTTLAFNGSPLVFELAIRAIWKLCGPVHVVAVAIAPAIALVWSLVAVGRHTKPNPERIAASAVASGLLGSLAIVLVTPMLVEDQPGTLNHLEWGYTPVRYALCFLCMAVIGLGLTLQKLTTGFPEAWKHSISFVFGCAALAQLVERFWSPPRFEMTFAAFVGINILVFGVLGCWLARISRFGAVLAIALTASTVSMGVGMLSERWHTGFAGHFDRFYGTEMFSDLDRVAPQRIVVLDERSYAFFGSRRQHIVFQPRVFSGIDDVHALVRSECATLVATRVERNQKRSRYRPAWLILDADPHFIRRATGRQLRLFEFTELNDRHLLTTRAR